MDSSIESLPVEQTGRVTPGESIVPEEGCLRTIGSFFWLRWHTVVQSFSESCCGKIKSIFMFITLPCYTLYCPVVGRRSLQSSKISQSGIIYFYILLSCTIVLNLWEQQEKPRTETATEYQYSQYFAVICMVVAILFLAYVNYSTRGRVIYGTRERNLILYFRTGLYVFGVSSLVYAMLNLLNFSNCRNGQHIILNIAKSAYITSQILFLNRFYQAKLPNSRLLQIALAHILGTNLSLWIWTLCKEVYEPRPDKMCTNQPIHLENTEKYFYPLFVEYLLLVASMMYELWANVQVTTDVAHRGDWHSRYYQQLEIGASADNLNRLPSSNQPTTETQGRRNYFVPSLAASLVLGLLFASVFVAFVLAARDSGKESTDVLQFHQYLFVNISLYGSQIVACYVILVCRQSQRRNESHNSVDLDDALLYFGLAGIIIWEGFHLYALCFLKRYHTIELANGVIGILEDILQTVTLVLARRYCSRNDTNAKTICKCALFLLATNLAMWVQNSFYIEQELENPGEHRALLQDKLKVFAFILNPIIIFFRFHSATCCYDLWSIFDPDD